MAKPSPRDTPMMRQYLDAKAEHPDCLLFMRMGDFFELFLDDAVEAAKLLGITLTSRNKDSADAIPMAGVPHRALAGYLPKLLAAGRKVAIMDQLEDPADAKGLVKRGLTRIITAGTLLDEDVLDDQAANFLVTITGLDGLVGIAALDCSTGRFLVEEADGSKELALALARLDPAELVLPEAIRDHDGIDTQLSTIIEGELPPLASVAAFAWKGADARRALCERLGVAKLDGYGIGDTEDHIAAAAGAALRYAELHARQALDHIRTITRVHRGEHLVIDATCRRNLELLRNSRDTTRRGSLLAAIDRTRTAPGARLLGDWLSRPLASLTGIERRHEAVAALVDDDALRQDLRDALDPVYDLERLLTRVATGRCHARDLVQLAGTLSAAQAVRALLTAADLPQLLSDSADLLNPAPELTTEINRMLVDEPPLAVGEGGMIRDGVDAELDDLRGIKASAGQWLAGYQVREAEASGIPKIKVGYNKVFGYYLEISKAHSEKAPDYFQRKQTLVNAERYITPELKEYEDKALGAEDRIRTIEKRLFEDLRSAANAALPAIQDCARGLALVDVIAGLAETARLGNWCRPTIDDSTRLELHAARHPVVEQVLGAGRFVANDCLLDAAAAEHGRLAVITGPNMAGKSTYIRQVALAVILAQAGSFVPADSAHIGVVDRLFTRVGAGDELARGMSTFMVEMAETAAILNHATAKSLVILDEVGRGTSTFDGLSLAWAITEHLHDAVTCRCLFATHYHELTDLARERSGVFNLTVAVDERDNEIAFLHRIVPGAATSSYGIHVAQLAGVPAPVLSRATSVLSTLDQLNVSLGEREAAPKHDTSEQLNLFMAAESPTLQRIKSLDVDATSPRAALDLLYQLRDAACKE
ncbi:MAG: DNA mismatch repair protein MutS [Planctomycetota bacterium]|jgi:DNA mismatch repair protein MutS|nr:DNA mismatch repair protein MutS [Planctomycetota bacterium]